MKWIKNNFKLIVFLVVLLVSFFVFEKFWVDLVNKFWVKPIASQIGCNILWVLLVFSFVVIFYYILEYCYSKTLNRKRFVIVLTFSAINILCFFSDNWEYTYEWTSFIIIIVLPFIGEVILWGILWVKNKIKDKENETPELEREKTTKIEDTYNRKEFWESTYNTLNTCFFEEGSFSVAISGSWGSGKTVFMEKLKEQYKENNKYVSIIEFEAWRCDTPNLIIRNFFTQLKNKLKIYIPNISLDFDKYIDLLLDDDSVKPLKIISKAIYNICKQEKDPFNKIKEELKKSKHKVVVFIDDVDRLDADEIKEVLRLIRNTADFPYIQFIFTCDKDYICETLKKKDIEKPELYLEKFINVEISLPKYEERIICEELYNRISTTIKEVWGNNVADNEIKDMIYYKLMEKNETEINRYLIPKILRTNRDVTHFYNTFKLIAETYKKQKNQNKIEFQDLFFIELLKFKYPNIHSYLWLNPIKFLNLNNNNLSIAWIRGKESKTRIDDIINDITNNTLNTNLSLSILKYLFENNSKKHSISNTENFDSYFMYRLNNKYLTMLQALSIIRDNKDNNFNIYNIEIIFKNKNKKQFEDRVSEILYNLTLEGDLNYIDIYNFLIKILEKTQNNDLKEEITNAAVVHLNNYQSLNEKHFKAKLNLFNSIEINNKYKFELVKGLFSNILSKDSLQESLGRVIIDEDTKYIEEYLTKTEHKELNRSILEEFAQENKYIADDMLTLTRDKIRDIIETLKS